MIEFCQARGEAGDFCSAGALPPMSPIVIYSQREDTVKAWTRRMREHPCLVATNWIDLERAAGSAACLLIQVSDLGSWPHLPQLKALRRDPMLTPLVIVTDRDAENLRSLAGVMFTEVCWTHGDPARIVDAAIRAAETARIRGLMGGVELTLMARRAAEAACRAERPFRSVKALAGAVGVDRRKLWLEWRRSDGQKVAVPLHDFVRWLLLIRAILMKQPGMGWAAVARVVGIHERTVFRLAEAFLEVSPRDLAKVHPTVALARFRQAWDPEGT